MYLTSTHWPQHDGEVFLKSPRCYLSLQLKQCEKFHTTMSGEVREKGRIHEKIVNYSINNYIYMHCTLNSDDKIMY